MLTSIALYCSAPLRSLCEGLKTAVMGKNAKEKSQSDLTKGISGV